MKRFSALIVAIALGLAACSPPADGLPTPGEVTLAPNATATINAPIVNTAVAGTAVAGTAVEATPSGPTGGDVTPQVEDSWAPTPIPPLAGGQSPTELKYQVLERYPGLFYCDPDSYPVAHGDESELAVQRFPQLQKNEEEFAAISKHLSMGLKVIQTDDEKLAVYREHKRLAAVLFALNGDSYQFQLQTQDADGNGLLITGLINGQGAISNEQKQPARLDCPICLSAGTRIDTPSGAVPVTALRVGDLVWTVDASGARVAAPLKAVGHVPAPAGHQMVHVVLADGRQLWASAGHPAPDGQPLGVLRPGDTLDGARVVSAEREPYTQAATYDILPAGATGLYWANGILLASTIR